jgi:hypothetical protein
MPSPSFSAAMLLTEGGTVINGIRFLVLARVQKMLAIACEILILSPLDKVDTAK